MKIEAASALKCKNTKKTTLLTNEIEAIKLPYECSFLTGQGLTQHLKDMKVAQVYTTYNRKVMADTILKAMQWDKVVVSVFYCSLKYARWQYFSSRERQYRLE